MEFALTGGVLFVLVTAVRWVMASPLSQALPQPHLQLAAVAVIVGAALAWALSSPWGRYSGGHLNPAVTVALWVTGVFPGRRVLPYVAAQLTGSVVGTGLARRDPRRRPAADVPPCVDALDPDRPARRHRRSHRHPRHTYRRVRQSRPPVRPRAVGRPARLSVTSVALSGGTAHRGGHHRPGRPVPGTSSRPLSEERPRTVARKAMGD
ncbi:aquaporin [Nonomuraea sp. B19D2]|uniref:aquaporin n=1 Tax=Nonomuraea sp. B19D2 TaxID=3159561 RepID=UPI0032DB9722